MKSKLILSILCLSSLFTGCISEDKNYAADGAESSPEVSIFRLRSIYRSNPININADVIDGSKYTAGVVVSNPAAKNLPEGLIAVQSEWRGQSRGILVKVNNPTDYQFGDSIRVDLIGARLVKENERLIIDNLPSQPTVVAKNIQKQYTSVSIGALLNNLELFDAQLINVTADVDPEPQPGTTFRGKKQIADGEGKKINLVTEENASFANERISPSATFQGVVIASQEGPELRLQKFEDMLYPSGKLYPGWPETFEEPYQGKTSYNVSTTKNLLTMSTGTWYLYYVIQGETAGRDRIVSGKQALRFQQNLSYSALAQMNFDVPNGASKVTFWYGSYYTDQSCTFQLEYSVDQGQTWHRIGDPISDAHPTSQSLTPKQAVFMMNIKQPVRFRINKLGLGTSNNTVSNGRLGVDDFAIYQYFENN